MMSATQRLENWINRSPESRVALVEYLHGYWWTTLWSYANTVELDDVSLGWSINRALDRWELSEEV